MASSCCGMINLQKACIITGSLEIVLAGAFLLYDVVILAIETPAAVEEHNNAMENPELDPYRFRSIRVVLCGMNALFWLGCLLLGFILIIAAKHRDLRKLRSWFILTCILTILFIVDILMEAFSMRAPVLAILSPTLGTVLQVYMLWIVLEFMAEVSRGGALPVKTGLEVMEEDA